MENRVASGLPSGSSFSISVGNGGLGSTNRNNTGENGTASIFDQGGFYEIVAGFGGGGGSDGRDPRDEDDDDDDDDENDRVLNIAARNGNPGSASNFNASSIGFSIVSSALYGGSGGGGGLGGANGDNARNEDRGGNGAIGRSFLTFDINLNRVC